MMTMTMTMMTMTMTSTTTTTTTNRRSSPRRWVLCGLLVVLCSTFRSSEAFVPVSHEPSRNACARAPLRVTSDEDPSASASISTSISTSTSISMEDLHDMDVVVYSLNDDDNNSAEGNDSGSDTPPTLYLGALQEDGILSPLSAWTDEPAFDDSIECLVDDVDRFSLKGVDAASGGGGVTIYHLLSEEEVSYGSRQCPRGPHNPHGEESELLYYVDKPAVLERFRIALAIKPELETLW